MSLERDQNATFIRRSSRGAGQMPPEGLTMARAMQPFPLKWTHQVSAFAKASTDIPAR
jgi:hypothetical protein